MNTEIISVPRWLFEWLMDVAREHRGQNEWKRGTTNRNSAEMAEMDVNISVGDIYLSGASRTLKSMAQHDRDRHKAIAASEHVCDPIKNGIACPDCGDELWDSNPSVWLTSNPMQKHVHCKTCGHKGYRIA